MNKTHIIIIKWLALPLLAALFTQAIGVKPIAFLLSGLTWATLLWTQRFCEAFLEPETPEEAKAIDDEVKRMEGRAIRLCSNFELDAPEGFRLSIVDDNTIKVIHVESKRSRLLTIRLEDPARTRKNLDTLIKEL